MGGELAGRGVVSAPDWLPDLLPFQGSWAEYVEAVFAIFERDFIAPRAAFRGEEIRLRWMPIYSGKPNAFWHLVQEGQIEDARTPDLRRCERIAWLRAIIENANDPRVKVWENERTGRKGRERSLLLWLEEEDFLVVLGKRSGYYLLLTAYPTNREHTRRKLRQEYEAYAASKP